MKHSFAIFAILIVLPAIKSAVAFAPAVKRQKKNHNTVMVHHDQGSGVIVDGSSAEINDRNYRNMVLKLANLLHESEDTLKSIQSLAKILMDMELENPSMASESLGSLSSDLADALADARANSHVFGVGSPESKQAWKRARLIAQGTLPAGMDYWNKTKISDHNPKYNEKFVKSHHTMLTVVDPKVLKDTIEAIYILEDLKRQVHIEEIRMENSKGSGLSP